MEQISRIKTTLDEVDLDYDERAFRGLSVEKLWVRAFWLISDIVKCEKMHPAIACYRNLLDSILEDLEEKGHPEGITAVNAAKDALRALEDVVNRKCQILSLSKKAHGTEFPYYFGAIDGYLKDYPGLLKAFKDALRKVLPHVRGDLKVKVNEMKLEAAMSDFLKVLKKQLDGEKVQERPSTLDIYKYLMNEVNEVEVPLKSVIRDLLGIEGNYNFEANWSFYSYPRDINEAALYIFQKYFQHDIDEASLSRTIKNELECLEKVISKVPKSWRARLQRILRDVRTAFDSLSQKLKALRTSCTRVIDDVESNGKSFSDAFSELNGMLREAEKGLSDLKERISDLERVLPSSPPMKLCELLCFMFIAILAIHSFLHLAEDKNSRVKTRWNTALYSLAVAGTIMHQMWVLWGGGWNWHEDGTSDVLRNVWSVLGCLAPVAVELLNAGSIESGVYSLTVAGVSIASMCGQRLIQCGMSWKQMCVFCAGHVLLAVACFAEPSKHPLLDTYGRCGMVCIGLTVLIALLLLVSYMDEADGEKASASGSGAVVMNCLFVMSVAVTTFASWVSSRDYFMTCRRGTDDMTGTAAS
uniref:NewinterC2i n=2 Tax=Encephalitozoon cuniculi (strain GB-M1) TaxID=284813 RepID=U4QI81_ENCCU|nr:NewinterC2i [Encephalitozoon cuniculi GB-M1]